MNDPFLRYIGSLTTQKYLLTALEFAALECTVERNCAVLVSIGNAEGGLEEKCKRGSKDQLRLHVRQ